jgi:GAF domain-containing protein
VAAAELADARYVALGVLDSSGSVTQFHAVGFDEQTQTRIGRLPRGDGILGLLVREPRPLRLDDLGRHPASVGFPAGHPPMTSFLGVPIRVRSQVFGTSTSPRSGGPPPSTTRRSGRHGPRSAAGIAIENARLYDAARRREGGCRRRRT